MNAPDIPIPDDYIQCKHCGEIVPEEDLTEVQLEMSACSEDCAYQEIGKLRQLHADLYRRSHKFQESLESILTLCDGSGTRGYPETVGAVSAVSTWGLRAKETV